MGLAQRIAETFATKVVPVGRIQAAIHKANDKQLKKILEFVAKNKDNYTSMQLATLRATARNKIKTTAHRKSLADIQRRAKPFKSKAPKRQRVNRAERVDSARSTTTGSTGQHLSKKVDKDQQPSTQPHELRNKSDILNGSLSGKELLSDKTFMNQASTATKIIGKENLNPHDLDTLGTRLLRNKKAQVSLVKKRMVSNSTLAANVKKAGSPTKFIDSDAGQAWIARALKRAGRTIDPTKTISVSNLRSMISIADKARLQKLVSAIMQNKNHYGKNQLDSLRTAAKSRFKALADAEEEAAKARTKGHKK